MNEKLRAMHQKMQDKITELKTLTAKTDYSAADDQAAQALETEITGIKSDIEVEQKRQERSASVAGFDSYLNESDQTLPVEVKTGAQPAARDGQEVPAQAKASPAIARVAKLKHFKTVEDALGFGMWFLGAVCNQEKGKKYCREHGIQLKSTGHTEGINSDGGATVPTQFSNTIIDLREEYGIFRSLVTVEPMSTDNMTVPRAVSGLTAYPVGESEAGTRSKTAWSQVELTARKWMVLVKYSTELNEDSIISWADRMANEIAMAFAQAEDEAGFIGDGSSTYHKIKGIIPTLTGLGTVANVAGLVELSGNAWGEITLADFSKMKGRLPAHIRKRNNVKWFCSGTFHAEVMEKLALAAGGNTAAQIVNGSEELRFMGHPVVLTETMEHVEGNSTVPVLLGDLNATVALGDRRGIALSLSEHSDFANDNIEIKGTERFDINVFNPGNVDAVAANRKAGGVVGGILAAA